ncbi:hypothetical protein ACFYKX_10160 [Cytobacillus sp. FJAT-54145]|uniref:Uncharacterized protein n=1 Tax=Cytobacillus spartinae TaxID=3299023 RepID=A0ABW6KDK5_9BACI
MSIKVIPFYDHYPESRLNSVYFTERESLVLKEIYEKWGIGTYQIHNRIEVDPEGKSLKDPLGFTKNEELLFSEEDILYLKKMLEESDYQKKKKQKITLLNEFEGVIFETPRNIRIQQDSKLETAIGVFHHLNPDYVLYEIVEFMTQFRPMMKDSILGFRAGFPIGHPNAF